MEGGSRGVYFNIFKRKKAHKKKGEGQEMVVVGVWRRWILWIDGLSGRRAEVPLYKRVRHDTWNDGTPNILRVLVYEVDYYTSIRPFDLVGKVFTVPSVLV